MIQIFFVCLKAVFREDHFVFFQILQFRPDGPNFLFGFFDAEGSLWLQGLLQLFTFLFFHSRNRSNVVLISDFNAYLPDKTADF